MWKRTPSRSRKTLLSPLFGTKMDRSSQSADWLQRGEKMESPTWDRETKDLKLNILRKGNVKYQEVLQDRTWAAAPAERTGIEPAPSGWRLRRGSRWASRRGRSRCPSPDTLSLWPETQPGLIWGQILEEDNKSQSVLKKTNENKHLKQLILWCNKTFNTTAFRSDAWFDSQSGKTRHFPLRSSASPSRHNQDVNGLRRADEKCMCLRSERCKCVDGRTITPEL